MPTLPLECKTPRRICFAACCCPPGPETEYKMLEILGVLLEAPAAYLRFLCLVHAGAPPVTVGYRVAAGSHMTERHKGVCILMPGSLPVASPWVPDICL